GRGGRPRARRAARAGATRPGAAVAREARGVPVATRGGAELRGDGGGDGGADSNAQDARAPRSGGAAAGAGGPRMNAIDPRIHQVLDGELAPGALSTELRRSVERLVTAVALLAAPLPLPSLEPRVMARIRRPVPSRARRPARGPATPRSVALRAPPVREPGLRP